MPKVVFFTLLDPPITQHAPDGYDVVVESTDLDPTQKAHLVEDADFLILFPSRIEEGVLRATRSLKHIQLVSAGFEHMDPGLCQELGVTVSNNGGANARRR